MYHEQTPELLARRKRKRIGILCALCALAVVCVLVYVLAGAHVREQGAVSLRESILSSAKQCCAIEGSYPASLAYLEQNYGLVVNHDDYLVTYEAFADNVLPSVVVVPR